MENMIKYEYVFKFADGRLLNFPVSLDKDLMLVSGQKDSFPEWVKLEYKQCPNCPLDPAATPHCPAAKSLLPIFSAFQGINPNAEVEITLNTALREYKKSTTVEDGVGTLAGLCMATSGCPVLSMLRPMVYYHVPFSSITETKYRVITMYLMAQYLTMRAGSEPDWKLDRLKNLYEEIQVINKNIGRRLSGVQDKGMQVNALLQLDCYAKHITLSLIDDEMLGHLRQVFKVYL